MAIRKKYITDKNGFSYAIDFISGVIHAAGGDYAEYYINNTPHKTRVYYRPGRTWNDHLGNTPAGYYIVARLYTGERRRVYLYY